MAYETLTAVFGWMAVINITILGITTLGLMTMRGFAAGIHGRILKLDEASLNRAYFDYLANYKIATLVFTVVPYFALRLAA